MSKARGFAEVLVILSEILVGDVLARLRADASQFNQVMQQTVQRLGQLNQVTGQVRAQQAQGVQATQQLTQSLQAQTRAVEQSSTAWRGMLQVAGGIGLATGLGAVISQMKDLAVQTVQTGTRLESLRASLSALGGGPGVGAQQFQMLADTAQRLGVAIEPLARGWRTLTAAATQAGLPLADQQRLLSALATEARRTGASNEELGRAIQAVGQMASKGRISMEELRQQLGEALVTSMAAAARGMGQTTEALIKLVETGTLSFGSFARGLTRGFEQLQSGAGALADTSQQAFTRLGNAWTLLQNTIMKSGLNTYLVQVAKNLQEAVEWTTKLAAGRQGAAGPSVQDLGASAGQSRELDRLNNIIRVLESQVQATNQTPLMRQTREEQLGRAREQREELLAALRLTTDQAAAQDKVALAANKTTTALEQQADFVKDLTKAFTDAQKAATQFREQAALAPERFGRLGGTLEDAEKFRRGLGEAQAKSVEQIAGLMQGRAPGTVVPPEFMAQFATMRQQYGGLEAATKAADEAEKARQKTVREAEQAQAKAAREAIQDQEEYQRAIDKTRMDIARQQDASLETLRRLTEQYGLSKEATDLDTASKAAAMLVGTQHQAQAEAYLATIEAVAKVEAQLPQLRREAAASAVAGAAAIKQVQDTERFEGDLSSRLEQLRAPRDERESIRLRRQAERQGIDVTPELDAQLKLIDAQAQWNTLMDHAGRLGDQMASTMTNGLMNIVQGTLAVGAGFKAMAKEILDSLAQIALNETFRMLFRLGLGVLGGLAGGAVGGGFSNAGASAGGGAGGFEILMAQGGAVVNKPTLALLGEGSTNPEVVLNRPQLNSLVQSAMRAGPSAGGQAAGNVVIINVPNAAAGEREAAQQRAMGHQVIINTVMNELSQGSGSRLGQVIKTIQR